MFLERKDALLDQTEDTAVLLDFFDARHFGRIGRKQASFHVFQLIFQIRMMDMKLVMTLFKITLSRSLSVGCGS